jgi:2,4-dichlorophenol 6-monooxygenase
VWGYDINQPAPVVDEAMATEIVHKLVGDDTIDVKLKSTSVWSVNHMYAEKASKGRVFCMGDAIHRHPPSNGLGSNTSIQDAYNLAWKLALVVKGQAEPSLLQTYDEERTPIARQIVDRSNKSRTQFGQIFHALGMTPDAPAGRTIESLKDDTPDGAAQREELRTAIELKDYEFNAHGVELGHRYRSAAVIGDGTPEPSYDRDEELYYHPTTWPGAHLPHVWLGRDGQHRVSTHDLAGNGRFCLLTGIAGEEWAEAAAKVADDLRIELAAHVIGPGREYTDLYDDWARVREIGESGCVLVRPDRHIAWRCADLPEDPAAELRRVLGAVLSRD